MYERLRRVAIPALAVALALFTFATAVTGALAPLLQRSIHMLFILVLVLLTSPLKRGPRWLAVGIDLGLIGLVVASMGWVVFSHSRILWRATYVDPVLPVDLVLGLIALVLVLEGTRRTLGWILVVTTLVFMGYALFGRYMPGMLAHRGVSLARMVEHLYLIPEGLFNSITGISATYLFTFMAFGSFLKVSGIDKVYMDLAFSLGGRYTGGPAKVSVISSAMMGTVSGAATVNVATTGAISIPMMKRMGYDPHVAAAIETAASTGGTIMPPVMGAGIFLMSELTGIPLVRILEVSIIPAIIYYFGVFSYVHFYSARMGFGGLAGTALPRLGETLRRGWHLLLPLPLLVYLLMAGHTPFRASTMATVALVLLSLIRRETRFSPLKVWDALRDSSMGMITVSALSANAAMIMGIITLTGLMMKVTSIMISLSQGILLIAIVLTFVVAYILGMGLPVTASYILVATLGAPALTSLGMTLLTAHLVIFWFSQTSTISPPVCMAAFTAARIAEAKSYYRVGFQALVAALFLNVLPLAFAYTPLIEGTLLQKLFIAATAFGFSTCLYAVVNRWLIRACTTAELSILVLSGVAWIVAALGGIPVVAAPAAFLALTLLLAVAWNQRQPRREPARVAVGGTR